MLWKRKVGVPPVGGGERVLRYISDSEAKFLHPQKCPIRLKLDSKKSNDPQKFLFFHTKKPFESAR